MTPASLIVLTYNTCDLTLQCLSSWYEPLLARGWQIIVVDNASTDATAQAVLERYPGVELIQSERNLGYAGGNNLGLRSARKQAILLLNSDVLATDTTLSGLVDALIMEPGVGARSAGLLTEDGTPQAFAYGCDPSLGYLFRRGANRLLGKRALHDWTVTQPMDVDWVSGACVAVRHEVIDQVGLLDERYFLYFEDTDWCRQMRQAGWRVVYDPRFRVTHLGGSSQPQRHRMSTIYYRSMIAFYQKHYSPLSLLVLRLLLPFYKQIVRL